MAIPSTMKFLMIHKVIGIQLINVNFMQSLSLLGNASLEIVNIEAIPVITKLIPAYLSKIANAIKVAVKMRNLDSCFSK